MGVVFRARQRSLNRVVALKMILAGQLASATDVARFRQEAEAAANLDHPNIVPIYEVGAYQGQDYFSMKLVEGQTLAQAIRAGQLPGEPRQRQRQAARLVEVVARAVHFAHQRGILHRDLKPSNILLERKSEIRNSKSESSAVHSEFRASDLGFRVSDFVPFVTDFGLAKRLEGGEQQTRSGAILGTPSYMAPEQAEGRKVLSTAADIYALGAILFELLTGRPPFVGQTPLDVVMRVLHEEAPRPRSVNALVDRDLETVCLKCLAREPARRYGSAEALADDLERWLAGEAILARPVGTLERAWKWARRRPALAALAGTVLLAIAGLFTVGLFYNARLQIALDEVEGQKDAVRQVQAEADERLGQARDLQRRIAYNGDLAWAHRELREAWPGRADELLDRHLDSDLCGWEWRYLKAQCHRELLTMSGSAFVAWSPDGKLLATAGAGGVILRDATLGKRLRILPNPDFIAGDAAFSSDGQILAVVAYDAAAHEEIALWDLRTGKRLRTWKDREDPRARPGRFGVAPALRPDGRQLALAIPEKGIALWDAAAEKVQRWLTAPADIFGDGENRLLRYEYTADGKSLLAITATGRIIRLSCESGQHHELFSPAKEARVNAVAFGANLGAIALCDFQRHFNLLRFTAAGDPVEPPLSFDFVGSNSGIGTLAVSPDGKRVLAASLDRTIALWQAAARSSMRAWRSGDAAIAALAFSPDGCRFASLGRDNAVAIWDASPPAADRPTSGLTDVAFSPDGQFLAQGRVTASRHPRGMAEEAVVELCDGKTGRPLRTLEKIERIHPADEELTWLKRVTFSPDGKRLAAIDVMEIPRAETLGGSASVRLLDTASGRVLFKLDQAGETVAFSPNGRWIATLASSRAGRARVGTIRLWHADTGALACTLEDVEGRPSCLAFSRNSKLLALGGEAVALFQVSESALHPLHAFPAEAGCLAFSPDGRYLATSAGRGDVRLWDVERRQLFQHIPQRRVGDEGPLDSLIPLARTPGWLAFSPDSSRLAYATDHLTIRLWSLKAAQDVLVLEDFHDAVVRLHFNPDGRLLHAIGHSRWHVWDAPPLPDHLLYGRAAQKRIYDLADKVGLREVVLARLQADPGISAGARKVALARMEDFEELALKLNTLAWDVVRRPGASAEAYALAVRQAERACSLAPKDQSLVNTLGVALYRVGKYREAVPVLKKSLTMVPEKEQARDFWDLGFLALCYLHLQEPGKAHDYLQRLKAITRDQRVGDEADYQNVLEEVERLVGGPPFRTGS
jgi:WD40 repeat protein